MMCAYHDVSLVCSRVWALSSEFSLRLSINRRRSDHIPAWSRQAPARKLSIGGSGGVKVVFGAYIDYTLTEMAISLRWLASIFQG